MKINNAWTDIEKDFAWRSDEIRFFENQLRRLDSISEQKQFRRATILLLYAHFEGFFKFSFLLYINYVNTENICCKDVNLAIKASTFHSVFKALRNPLSKDPLFSKDLPDDSKLHLFSRDLEFLEKTSDIENKKVDIPDDVIDVESNLKPIVLKKILFRLGLDHKLFSKYDGTINKLLNYRNQIAHGAMKEGIDHADFISLRNDVLEAMTSIKSKVMNSLIEQCYLKITRSSH